MEGEAQAMNEEAQRIAIAEACGWTAQEIEAAQVASKLRSEYSELSRRDSFSGLAIGDKIEEAEHNEHYRGPLPDVFNDLNAMHEAEKVLTAEQADSYFLKLMFWPGGISEPHWLYPRGTAFGPGARQSHSAHATAKQRAEALLRTIGKWEEE